MARLEWNEDFEAPSLVASYEWGNAEVDYAEDVCLGLHYIGGRGIARDWTVVAIARNNCPQVFADRYRGNIRDAFDAFAHHMATEFSDVIDTHDFGGGGKNEKQYRPGVPTWSSISDSGALRDSLHMEVRDA